MGGQVLMAKGTIAKQNITQQLQNYFGNDFIGEFDKKIYLWADDGGEKVQIALSMTCPKNPVGDVEPTNEVVIDDSTAELTPEEDAKVKDLLKKLGF